MKGFTVLLRSVSTVIPATGMLYLAADMLTPGRNPEQRATNKAVITMVTRMLALPDTNPEIVEHTLRNLPPLD